MKYKEEIKNNKREHIHPELANTEFSKMFSSLLQK